ncbi:hypothetical protein [Streptomyces sp. NPDC054975]
MPDTAPRPRLARSKKIVITCLLLIGWTLLASQWQGKHCDFIPQSYFLVITHGTPDANEGCEETTFGTSYTDEYRT